MTPSGRLPDIEVFTITDLCFKIGPQIAHLPQADDLTASRANAHSLSFASLRFTLAEQATAQTRSNR